MNRLAIVKPAIARPAHYSVAPGTDHYQVLGLGRQASGHEIDLAFFKLAGDWHPMLCRRQGGAEVFARIAEAHRVLSDPIARFKYDLTLTPAVRAPQPSHPAVAAYHRIAVSGTFPPPASKIDIGV